MQTGDTPREGKRSADAEADVVIVGAGIVGMTTGDHLARDG